MNVDFDTFLSLYCQSPQRKSFRRNCHVHTYLGFCPCCSLRIGDDELCARSFQTPSTITHSAKQRHGAGADRGESGELTRSLGKRARWHVCCHDRRWADVEGGCGAGCRGTAIPRCAGSERQGCIPAIDRERDRFPNLQDDRWRCDVDAAVSEP